MNIEVTYQDNADGTIYDISNLVMKPSWVTNIEAQPGKFTFSVLKDTKVVYNEGSVITLVVDGVSLFYGYLFTVVATDKESIALTCYDQMRYLKGKDTYVFTDSTLGEQFIEICQDNEIKHSVVHTPTYVLPPVIRDNKTLFSMVAKSSDTTLIATGDWYIMRDNFGTLELLNINELKTTLIFSEGDNVLSFNHKSSIDSDTYNFVKLAKDNKEEGVREIYIVKDSESIAKWGKLQYFEKVDENANAAQIEERATQILTTKNRKTRTMKFVAIGDLSLRSGDGIVIIIEDGQATGFEQGRYYFITKCTHKFDNDNHTMSLEVKVSV